MNSDYDPLAAVQAAGPPGTISFIYGLPDPATFPVEGLRHAAERVLVERPEVALQYGPEQGYGPLIDCVRERILREEGLALERPQMMLTGGSAQALDHLCTLFSRPSDLVLVEAPTYHETLQLFRDHGLIPIQVETDHEGLRIEAMANRLETLARSGRRARMIYTIPNFQNPSGITLTADRRPHLLQLAKRYDLLVVEDDVYRDLAYDESVPPSLYELDESEQRVLRIGSFSKILAPAVRMGWLIGPPSLIGRLIGSGLRCMGGGANPLMANILADFCRQGLLDQHIVHLREIYRERRDAMLGALDAFMPDRVDWTKPAGGFFVWLHLPHPLKAADVVARAKEESLLIPSGNPFFAERPAGQFLRLAYSYVTPQKIERGVETLGHLLTKALQSQQ
jgi:2-aminoadipate transaminase